MDPNMIAALRAQGFNDTQIATMLIGMQAPQAAAPATPAPALSGVSSVLAGLRNAPAPNTAGQSLVDDEGKFDGDYVVELTMCELAAKQKGQVFRAVFRVEDSSNPLITKGSEREFPLFLWNPPALSECKGFVQMLSGQSDWTAAAEQYFGDMISEKQVARGVRLHLSVFTKAQKQNKAKMFTHHRWSLLAPGEQRSVAAPVAAPAPVAPAANPLAGLQLPPGFVMPTPAAAPAPAPAAPATALPATPPPGWPPNVPWPGAR